MSRSCTSPETVRGDQERFLPDRAVASIAAPPPITALRLA
jgi:hypothetical protein